MRNPSKILVILNNPGRNPSKSIVILSTSFAVPRTSFAVPRTSFAVPYGAPPWAAPLVGGAWAVPHAVAPAMSPVAPRREGGALGTAKEVLGTTKEVLGVIRISQVLYRISLFFY